MARTLPIVATWLIAGVLPAVETTVMTFNILRPGWGRPDQPSWESRLPGIAAVIQASSATLVGLQEEDARMREDLLARLPGWSGIGGVPEKGASMIIRDDAWTVTASGSVQTHAGRVAPWIRAVPRGGSEVWIVNNHMTPFEEKDRIHSAHSIRTAVVGLRAKAALPVIMLGDWNAEITAPSYAVVTGAADGGPAFANAWFLAHGFTTMDSAIAAVTAARQESDRRVRLAISGAAVPEAGPEYLIQAQAGTLHGFFAPGIMAIDHILISPEIRVLAAGVDRSAPGGILPSDHYPVWARLTWSEAPAERTR